MLKDFAQALEKQLPEGTVLSVVLRETPTADNGLTPELLTACFDRVYVMPEADASALPTGYDAATRVVAMTAYAPRQRQLSGDPVRNCFDGRNKFPK